MPRYVEELRAILTVKGRIIGGTQLEDMLKLVNAYRED
jgi:DNA-directed RNA polymerase subunit F